MNVEPIYILPAEFVGLAEPDETGCIDVGGIKVPWKGSGPQAVFVRRSSDDLSVMEICMAHHDGLANEELEEQNRQADIAPEGAKEYWRSQMVGKYTYGPDGHLMTNEDFETDWDEGVDDED